MFTALRLQVSPSISSRAASLLVLGLLTALALTRTAAAATTPCEQQVLRDWADDGRIDGTYQLPCYEDAIAGLPTDLRDYTNAAEVIRRALAAAVRSTPSPSDGGAEQGRGDGLETSSAGRATRSSPVPTPLLVLGVSLAALATGALAFATWRAFVGRRRSGR